jgi:hypothetical protein
VAVLSEGRICLDAIAERHAQTCGASDLISRVFPEGKQRDVNCVSLTKELLIYGTHSGSIVYVYLPELVIVSDVRHQHPIASIFPNELGTRLVYFDAPVSAPVASSSYFYSPIDDSTIPVSKLPPSAKGVLWDTADWCAHLSPIPSRFVARACCFLRRVFVGYDSNSFFVYVYTALSIDGPSISQASTCYGVPDCCPRSLGLVQASSQAIKMPGPNLLPVLVHDGSVICQVTAQARVWRVVTLYTLPQMPRARRRRVQSPVSCCRLIRPSRSYLRFVLFLAKNLFLTALIHHHAAGPRLRWGR